MKLRSYILRYDVDILTGFNLTFDNGFLQRRLQQYSGMALDDLARPRHSKSTFETKVMKTAALGNNELVLWNLPGRIVIDLFLFSKANYPQLPNHKLNTCGQVFLNAGKDDIAWGTILQAFSDDAATTLRGDVAKYCLQDGFLCIQLMNHWSAHVAVLEEASACAMNAGAVPDSGRQSKFCAPSIIFHQMILIYCSCIVSSTVKVISLLLTEIYHTHVFNPPQNIEDDEDDDSNSYEGAMVIDTIKVKNLLAYSHHRQVIYVSNAVSSHVFRASMGAPVTK